MDWNRSRMGDTLKKVKPGDPLAIPAEAFNTFIDAARDFRYPAISGDTQLASLTLWPWWGSDAVMARLARVVAPGYPHHLLSLR